MLFPVVRAAIAATWATQSWSLSVCFIPLLALQADHVAKLTANVRLQAFVELLSLSKPADEQRLAELLTSLAPLRKSVLVFLNPEKFAVFKDRFIAFGLSSRLTSHLLFDEVHTYVSWADFRGAFSSLRGIAADFKGASLVCATATLAVAEWDQFCAFVGVSPAVWTRIQQLERRHNQFYHVIEETLLLRHKDELFHRDRMPLLIIVTSIGQLVSLQDRVMEWTGLPKSAVMLYAGGFSDGHKSAADTRFRNADEPHVVMIATTAYALGIDANIVSVIQFGVPSSLAALVQGAGRAGRGVHVEVAHCTLVVDANGLRAADDAIKRFLGTKRPKSKKPDGSIFAAQCSVCRNWCHLPPDAHIPSEDDMFLCSTAGATCANISRFPICVHVMIERFLKGDVGLLDRPVEATETKCIDWCDCCSAPPVRRVPRIAEYVKVVSSLSAFFQRVGQVIELLDDNVRAFVVNFGAGDCDVKLSHDILALHDPVRLPDRILPTSSHGPKILMQHLIDFVADFVTDLPRGSLILQSGYKTLVAKRPMTAIDVMRVCKSVHPVCAGGIARVIAEHQAKAFVSVPKKPKTKSSAQTAIVIDSDGDEEDNSALFVSVIGGSQSLSGRKRTDTTSRRNY